MTQEMQTVKQKDLAPMRASQVYAQVQLVQQVMKQVMKENTHYGAIPGCGKKKTLWKPGAETLGVTFRLAPSYEIERIDPGNMHREYQVCCTLTHIKSGEVWGQGVGSCSTLEPKYRYRKAEAEVTDKPVPLAFWDARKIDPKKAVQQYLGGPGHGTKKVDGGWFITKESSGEKVENPDPAERYNTVLKMAKKRAQVDAVLTATAASDIFTQDIDEQFEEEAMADNAKTVDAKVEDTPPPQEPPDLKAEKHAGKTKDKAKPKSDAKPDDAAADRLHYVTTIFSPMIAEYKKKKNVRPLKDIVANINKNAKTPDELSLKELKEVVRILPIEINMASDDKMGNTW